MQQIDDRIPSGSVAVITRREVDRNLPVRGIAFEIPLE